MAGILGASFNFAPAGSIGFYLVSVALSLGLWLVSWKALTIANRQQLGRLAVSIAQQLGLARRAPVSTV